MKISFGGEGGARDSSSSDFSVCLALVTYAVIQRGSIHFWTYKYVFFFN